MMHLMSEAREKTLEEAVKVAHDRLFKEINKIKDFKTDFLVTRVVDWGYRKGGFTHEDHFYVRLIAIEGGPINKIDWVGGFDSGNA